MFRRTSALLLSLSLAGCASATARNPYAYDEPGPTLMANTVDGYTLHNQHLHLLIDPTTGDAIAFGRVTGPAIAIAATCNGVIPQMHGYLEARDIQTWEYLGDETGAKVSWRKIYCLDGDRLLVTYLIRNEGTEPMDSQMGIAPLPAPGTPASGTPLPASQPSIAWHMSGPNNDAIEADGFRIKCFNEGIVSPPSPPEILRNDPRKLAPGEGIAWTMVWTAQSDSVAGR